MDQLVVLALLVVVFYLLLIRPQQKRAKDHQRLISSIGVGDEVVTIGGIFGRVRKMDEVSLLLEVADGVQVRFARQAISRKIAEEDHEPETSNEESGSGSE